MPGPAETFRLPARWRVGFWLLYLSVPVAYMVMRVQGLRIERELPIEIHTFWSPAVLIIAVVVPIALLIHQERSNVIVVNADLIVYHRFWRVHWNDVVGSSERSFLGSPYLHLRRRSGVSIWLPLFYVGQRHIRDVLREYAPEGHPIRTGLTTRSA